MTLTRAALLSLAVLAAACGGAAAVPPVFSAGAPAPSAPLPSPTPRDSSGAPATAARASATASPLPATAAPATAPPATAGPATAAPATPVAAPVGARIDLHQLPLADAEVGDATVSSAGVVLASGTTGTWTSRWYEPGFAFTRLVPSWSADTPGASFIRVRMQARATSGEETAWYSFGIWAYDDATVARASSDGQRDRFGRIDTDTYLAAVPASAYRLRVELFRATASAPSPVLRSAAAVSADAASIATSVPCAPGGCPLAGTGKDLPVPPYSQEIHAGEYAEFDGGGEAWCSPTSTAMVLAYWGKGPTAADTSWVSPRYRDPVVDHAARYTYDSTYGGTGNWSFNAAYAAHYDMRAFVTQLRSLGEAERFIAAGIPLVASVKVKPGGLPGFLYQQGSSGHVLVIRGFTASGDVISNDPAATGNDSVRRVYPRAAFETAWLGGSGGTVYVITPPSTALPAPVQGMTRNW